MSEARNDYGRKPITRKAKKLNPRVDLTAMVSVSFLLIIFFMLTSYLSKPNAMDLGMPQDSRCGWGGCYFGCGQDRSLTLLLGKNDKIVSYQGYLSLPIEGTKKLSFDRNSIRKELLLKNQQMIQQTGDPRKGLIVLIKPSKNSNYGNLVSILDEMAISKINTYAVLDITPEEEKLLAAK
jgi:biopolymer transport protein ExbD